MEINCQKLVASFSDRVVTLQELKDARRADIDCNVESMEAIHRRIADYKNNPQDYSYEKGAFEFLKTESNPPSPAHTFQTNFRLFVGDGLSRASEPNKTPAMPKDRWFQAGVVYAIGSERFRARGGLLGTWSGNKEVGGVSLGPFIGDELHIPSLHLMTSVDVILQFPLQAGLAWGVKYDGVHQIQLGTSVGFLIQANEKIKTDKDMAWVGANFAYVIGGR